MSQIPQTAGAVPLSPKIRSRQGRTRQRILRESAHLFLRKGFANTSVEDIIEAAEIARSSFYRFFSNREEVLANIIRPVFETGLRQLDDIDTGGPHEIMEGIFQTYLDLWLAGPDELRIATRFGGVYFYLFQDIHYQYRVKLLNLIRQAAPSGILLNDDAEMTGRLIARCTVPALEVYHEQADFHELFRRTMRGMLLKAEK